MCFKQNIHKHSLEWVRAQAKLFEPASATYTCADAASLFEDRTKGEHTGGHGLLVVHVSAASLYHSIRMLLLFQLFC